MSDAALLDIVRRLPPEKAEELYDFANFLDMTYRTTKPYPAKLEGFSSETEMLDFINDIAEAVYAD